MGLKMRINPYKTQLGSFLPNGIMTLTTIGSTGKLIYGRLCQFAGEKGYCWPAISTLAFAIGCSKTTVKKAIKELLGEKLIEVEHRFSEDGDATSNLYFFLDHPALHIHPLNGGPVSASPPSVSALPRAGADLKENQLRSKDNSKGSSNSKTREPSAAATNFKIPSSLPLEIEEAIKVLALGQAHLQQVRMLIIQQLKTGLSGEEISACLTIFNERLPRLRNKNNPCSLLVELFRARVGIEHMEVIKENKLRAEATALAQAQLEAKYAEEQAKLDHEAAEWVRSQDGQRFIKLFSLERLNQLMSDLQRGD